MPHPSKLESIIASVEKLTPIPTSVSRVLMLMDDPNATARDISDMIGMDPALAATVMQMANSVSLGYTPAVSTLSDAVMRLGFKRIKTILIGAGVSSKLNKGLSGYRYGSGVLWNHSVSVATAAQWLSQALRYPDPDEAYVAGLLHDMGKLLLDEYIQVDYMQMVDYMTRYQMNLRQVEEKMFGIDHGGVGGLMAQRWNFPIELQDTIHYHHAPSLVRKNSRLAAIVNLANGFDTKEQQGLVDPPAKRIHPETLNILNLDFQQVDRLKQQMFQYFKIGS
jgi:putative nucleotidyltransferase with HDIG domain